MKHIRNKAPHGQSAWETSPSFKLKRKKQVDRVEQKKEKEVISVSRTTMLINDFESMMTTSYDFDKKIFYNDWRWRVLEELYNKNFLHPKGQLNYSKMPRKIHQIWLGGIMPSQYQKYADTWKRYNPYWEYKLWTDKDVDDVDMPNRDLFNSISNNGQKSDFLRYHILNQFGGLYIDTDFECVKSFDTLSYADFLVGIGYPSNVELYIGLLGCSPNHPIMEEVIKSMNEIKEKGWREIFETTGTYFFTRNFFKVVSEYKEGIIALPPDFFYPFPNTGGHERRNGINYIKDCSYAVHHWAVSWSQK